MKIKEDFNKEKHKQRKIENPNANFYKVLVRLIIIKGKNQKQETYTYIRDIKMIIEIYYK